MSLQDTYKFISAEIKQKKIEDAKRNFDTHHQTQIKSIENVKMQIKERMLREKYNKDTTNKEEDRLMRDARKVSN